MVETCITNPAIDCSFLLLRYDGTTIEINLVGAVLPLVLSLCLMIYYRKKFDWPKVATFTAIAFLIVTAIGSVAGTVYHTISYPGWALLLFWIFMVVSYSRLKIVRGRVVLTAAELYVVGTFGVFLDDIARTSLGFLDVPVVGLRVTTGIWGGAGPTDGLFMTGAFQALLFILLAIVLVE